MRGKGRVVVSSGWIVKCASKVNSFRETLSPEEAELFNECLVRICRNPNADGIHKTELRVRLPIVDLMYRDDNFVLIYYPTRITKPYKALNIYIFQATRVRDLDEGNAPPRR